MGTTVVQEAIRTFRPAMAGDKPAPAARRPPPRRFNSIQEARQDLDRSYHGPGTLPAGFRAAQGGAPGADPGRGAEDVEALRESKSAHYSRWSLDVVAEGGGEKKMVSLCFRVSLLFHASLVTDLD